MLRKIMVFTFIAMMVVSGFAFAGSITIVGSSTVLPVAQRAAEVYMQRNNDVDISVRGGGSGTGIATLVDGACDIADASRFIKDKEVKNAVANGIYPVPHRVALDGIAVVVNPANPVDNLTLEEIKGIYTGKITNWQEVGGNNAEIVVISRDSSSGTFAAFGELALDEEKVTPNALLQASNGAVAGVVSENKDAIGYVGLGYLSPSLQAVSVNGVECTIDTVKSGSYAISRALFMFTNGWPTGTTADFINFILSEEGQEIVGEQGYVRLF
ncbi:phosphate ABC transporter substrate-binding protein [Halocella sp. SP3-1]|uniref:phosphate ABC transporter substrate-binding protein n=1 Tax=Halocella sp. SP3-1 TaxID=2382161 RepID=UPI000F7648A7|nr:phosphate ABC transporter substrate-binding protein [Halocella sp. SP3-1]AZO93222.1 phosphate ABC transporter substrate-binding protein [Halocella sp. SP3-1]MTI59835.1 phosphate ABC transporter substrate-binding protein [Bacillota bacterium]